VGVRGRKFGDVVADVIEGVLVSNDIPQGRDMRTRRRLLRAVEGLIEAAA
jgi:hypothetical protein